MPEYNFKKIVKVLEEHGFVVVRRKGSHVIYRNNNDVMVPVPFHGKKKSIPLGTALAIIKQSKIDRNLF